MHELCPSHCNQRTILITLCKIDFRSMFDLQPGFQDNSKFGTYP